MSHDCEVREVEPNLDLAFNQVSFQSTAVIRDAVWICAVREAALLLVDVGTADYDVSKAPRDNSRSFRAVSVALAFAGVGQEGDCGAARDSGRAGGRGCHGWMHLPEVRARCQGCAGARARCSAASKKGLTATVSKPLLPSLFAETPRCPADLNPVRGWPSKKYC